MFSSPDSPNLLLCPSLFALNCKEYHIKCNRCKANKKGKILYYKPLLSDPSLSIHPLNSSITPSSPSSSPLKVGSYSYKKQNYSRLGRVDELKFIERESMFFIKTKASGSYLGEGDALLVLPSIKLQTEIKCRYTPYGIPYPSSKELKEGLNRTKPISLWIIIDKNKEEYAYLHYKAFYDLYTTSFSHGSHHLFETTQYYVNISKGTSKRSIKLSFDTVLVIDNPIGKFVYMKYSLLRSLLSLLSFSSSSSLISTFDYVL